jgi:hypothetical protein
MITIQHILDEKQIQDVKKIMEDEMKILDFSESLGFSYNAWF